MSEINVLKNPNLSLLNYYYNEIERHKVKINLLLKNNQSEKIIQKYELIIQNYSRMIKQLPKNKFNNTYYVEAKSQEGFLRIYKKNI